MMYTFCEKKRYLWTNAVPLFHTRTVVPARRKRRFLARGKPNDAPRFRDFGPGAPRSGPFRCCRRKRRQRTGRGDTPRNRRIRPSCPGTPRHAPATAPPDRTSAAATREEADTLDITTWEYLCRYRDSTGGGISHPDTLCISVAGIRLHTLESVPALGRSGRYAPDTTILQRAERNRRLYDSIAAKTSRRAVPRLLYKMLFVRPVLDTTDNGRVLDEDRLFEPYAGKTIGEIAIAREQVFSPDGNWFERTGNNVHVLTRDRVIRRDLLFRPGDKVDPQILVRNKQLLRSRAYISDAELEIVPPSAS